MKVFIGTDHNGFHLKESLIAHLNTNGHDVVDTANHKLDPADDYPIFAQKLVVSMLASNEKDPMGILICGSGQGMCMAANRFKGIRAALVYDLNSAKSSRNDDDANVACLPADSLRSNEAAKLVDAWLNTPFAHAPRFKRRIIELDQLG